MNSTLVPIEFAMPSQEWRLAPEETAHEHGVLSLAYGPGRSEWFTSNITVAGQMLTDADDDGDGGDAAGTEHEAAGLADFADDAVRTLVDDGAEVEVLQRRAIDGDDPGLLQMLRTTVTIEGEPRRIRQLQAFLQIVDASGRGTSVVYTFTLSAAEDDFEGVGADFQEFLRSVRPTEQPA